VTSVGHNQGVRLMRMHLSMHLSRQNFRVGTDTLSPCLVTRSVNELRPHPSYASHKLSVQPFKLGALDEQGDLGFSHPLIITRDKFIIDGYARWDIAKRRGRPTLNCIEYNFTAEEALEDLIRSVDTTSPQSALRSCPTHRSHSQGRYAVADYSSAPPEVGGSHR